MYIQIKKINKRTTKYGFDTIITHIGLYKDDGEFIKWIWHDDRIVNKIQDTKTEISIPELEWLLKEHEIDKLIPSTVFNHIELKWLNPE